MALRESGLVESRKDGLKVYYRLTDPLTADLLAAALGPAPRVVSIAGCPCPACDESPSPVRTKLKYEQVISIGYPFGLVLSAV